MTYEQALNYFTPKFLDDHVYFEGRSGGKSSKKASEQKFQSRSVGTSSLLILNARDLIILACEVRDRQGEYQARTIYTTIGTYRYHERSGKRSKEKGPAHFNYAAQETNGTWRMHHFDGVE